MASHDRQRFVAGTAPVHQLSVKAAFEALQPAEQRYAHHMSRASWHGARIVLRQTSPESIPIFDWIMSLYHKCNGEWEALRQSENISSVELRALLVYAANFLSNLGNYYGSGDQKFVPDLSLETLRKLSLDEQIATSALQIPPYSLGFPSEESQSTYYPGQELLSKQEISDISHAMEAQNIYPENTRLTKRKDDAERVSYDLLQASCGTDANETQRFDFGGLSVSLVRGDHTTEMQKICDELRLASQYTANKTQRELIQLYIKSFETGDLTAYREALRLWVHDVGPTVEHIIGFVEPYRDPYGIRAEFEGLVAIADPKETETLRRLVEHSDAFIRELPWCDGFTENNGKGPFEKALFEPPDFSSIHVLAYCSSIIFPGINLPNYNDIRQEDGFKNFIIANRMSAESSDKVPNPYVNETDAERFTISKVPAYYIWVVLHELFGHGTGKMMCQQSEDSFNFDRERPPVDPLTGQPIKSWYLPGQTWTGQFKDLSTTVDECRCELVGAYLMDNKDLLALFGYGEEGETTIKDLIFCLYMQVATDGLRGLMNFNADSRSWGQAHSRAHFAMLKCLLRDSDGCVKVDFDQSRQKLTVHIDETRIIPHAKAALGKMLLKLHMFRCTADAEACREYYEDLSQVDGEYLQWRDAVLARQPPKWVFVHANTYWDDGVVTVKEYEPTLDGVIQSWAERHV